MVRAVLFCFSLLGLCHFATAGEAPIEEPLPGPRGIRFAHLQLYPALNYDLTYTDNAGRSRRERDDILQEYVPSLDLRAQPHELISLNAFYAFGWHDYAKNEVRDYLSHVANAEMRARNLFVEGLSIVAGDSYLQSGNTSPLQNEFLQFARYQTNDAYAKAEYDYNRFTITGKIDYGFVDYFSRANQGSDYKTYSGEISGAYRFLPERLILFGTYNLTRTVRDLTNTEDFDNHTMLLGVRGTYSKLHYSVAAGYNVATFLNRDEEDDGPSVLMTLDYTPHDRMTFSMYASRRFTAAALPGISTETDAGASTTIRILRRAKFIAAYSFADSDRIRGQDIQTWAGTATFEYRFTRNASAVLSYSHTERDVSSGTGGYIENATRLGFRLAW